MNAFYHRFGLYNTRPVGRPLLLRSTDLHTVNEDGRRYFVDIGLNTIIDIRDRAEREARPNAVAGIGANVVTAPLFDSLREAGHGPELARISEERSTASIYAYMVRHCGAQIGAIASCVAEPGALSAVIHCVGGKDRTGVVVAVILSAVGVPEDSIVADYLLSAEVEDAEWLRNYDFTSMYGPAPSGPFLEREWMETALSEIRTGYGDGESYLLQHGVAPQAISSLRDALLGR